MTGKTWGFQLDLITLSSQTGKEQQGRQSRLLKAEEKQLNSLRAVDSFPEGSGPLNSWRAKEVSTNYTGLAKKFLCVFLQHMMEKTSMKFLANPIHNSWHKE